jgi:hypothetical protein
VKQKIVAVFAREREVITQNFFAKKRITFYSKARESLIRSDAIRDHFQTSSASICAYGRNRPHPRRRRPRALTATHLRIMIRQFVS